ncbi:FAD-dependent thymidylate synthase [Candidatus Woesearchaeota archaeon]|nr:FAD-dependent thymidylate synthase [Candidatus Woesearchaeota archaeon]
MADAQQTNQQNQNSAIIDSNQEDLGATNKPPYKREIFAIAGVSPEVLAVGMAKYSRSALSIKETISELTEEKSAEFHEKWVIGYGDASVADMAQVQIACENVSILASKVIEDNRLGSYQEKSTRYQKFDRGRFYKPAKIMQNPALEQLYEEHCNYLFDQYILILDKMTAFFMQKFPRPQEMKENIYASKVKARALDAARYVLPVSTLTNLGFSINARSLRHAISKMLGHHLDEIKEIGLEVKNAALNTAYNPQQTKITNFLNQMKASTNPELQAKADEISKLLSLQVKGAPTLIKHTDPKEYLQKIKLLSKEFTESIVRFNDMDAEKEIYDAGKVYGVDFVDEKISYEDELIATVFYEKSRYSFRQILNVVKSLTVEQKQDIINSLGNLRGQFDWLSRHYEIPGALIFDTFMDYGCFRDIQRHRLCTQINQELSIDHGYYVPKELVEAGADGILHETLKKNIEVYNKIAQEFPAEAQYVIALGSKKRTLFKMNLRELNHIIELRSKPGGHIAYRWLAYEMYEQVKQKYPLLMQHSRVMLPDFERDFFLR